MNNEIGQAIKEIRESNHWTLEEMAKKLGTTKQALSRYERGERVPKLSVANDFAKKLGIPLPALVGEEPDPYEMPIGTISRPIHPVVLEILDESIKASETQRQIREREHQNVLKLQKIFESLTPEGQEYLLQQADIAMKLYGEKR